MKTCILAFLLLVSAACAENVAMRPALGSPTIRTWACTLPADQCADVEAAADDINTMVGAVVLFHTSMGQADLVVRQDPDKYNPYIWVGQNVQRNDEGQPIHAYYLRTPEHGRNVIAFVLDASCLDSTTRTQIARHEFMHALGFPDVADGYVFSMMNHSHALGDCHVTPYDRRSLALYGETVRQTRAPKAVQR